MKRLSSFSSACDLPVKALLICTLLSATFVATGHAQGTVAFANGATSLCLVCQNGSMVPAPVGTAFQVALYYAPDGTSGTEFEYVAIRLGAAVGFGPTAGRFNGGTRTAPTAQPGGLGLFQVRGWQTAYGSSYEMVLASGQGMVGKSPILRISTGNPTTTPQGSPTPLTAAGLQGFGIAPLACPEPSTAAFAALLGAVFVGGLLIRKKPR